jgi:hypothetical protein
MANRIGRVIIRVNLTDMTPVIGLATDTRDRVFTKMYRNTAANALAFLEDWDDVPEVEVVNADEQERIKSAGAMITSVEFVPGLEFQPVTEQEQRQVVSVLVQTAVSIVQGLTVVTANKLEQQRRANGSGRLHLPGRS